MTNLGIGEAYRKSNVKSLLFELRVVFLRPETKSRGNEFSI